jgi:transposase-like protein
MPLYGGVWVTKRDQFVFDTMSQFISGKITRKQAATLLRRRERTVSRLARRIEMKGVIGVAHGNRARAAHNRLPGELKTQTVRLMQTQYFDFNLTHALEKLKERHGIKVSHDTLRRWCHEKGLVKRAKRRRAKVRRQRDRMAAEGLLLQMDGSPFEYNGRDMWTLIAAIDDATSDIPYAEFFLSEDTLNCMTVLQRIIERKGLPYAIYTDQAGWLAGNKRAQFTQFKRACDDLGIRLIPAYSAQAKGRIERAWDTFQDRIVPEMRLRKICHLPAANTYLQEHFLPGYWRQNNVVVARELEPAYRRLDLRIQLSEVLCLKEWRSVQADHTISYDGVIYRIDSPTKYSLWKQKVELRTYQDLTQRAFFADQLLSLTPVVQPQRANLPMRATG